MPVLEVGNSGHSEPQLLLTPWPPPPPSTVHQGMGTTSPPGVSFFQPVGQDIAGLLPLCGQTLVGSGMRETGPEAFPQFKGNVS